MSRSSALATGLLLASGAAWPCGPDFPLELLSQRDAALAQMPDGLFDLEATRLVSAPTTRFVVAEHGEAPDARLGGQTRERELYAKAAKTWHTSDRGLAAKQFAAVLALPEAERLRFTIPAEYMLGESSNDGTVAAKHFASLRAHAEAGYDDPMGLAVASLGEEARRALWAHDDAKAVVLYARQAAHGSSVGTVSLLMVARQLAGDNERLLRALAEPVVQRLMAMYLWSRATEDWWAQNPDRPSPNTVLSALARLPKVSGAAHLSAALYRAGRFEEAATFARLEDTAVAHWVRAKLLLRSGLRKEADQELALAAKTLTAEEDWGPIDHRRPLHLIEGERAILALSRDDFDGAMGHVRASCSWPDVAWVAERVLEVDALKRLVDGLPPVDPCRRRAPSTLEDEDRYSSWGPDDQHEGLRRLLARRLMRADRGREALPYFGSRERVDAELYVSALERAKRTSEPLEAASALYEASLLARWKGLQLLATEAAPDFGWTSGAYDPRSGEWGEGGPPQVDAGLTTAEGARAAANSPAYDRRFHYRHMASRLAEAAANKVSPRSRVFTVLLCTAARFIVNDDPERVQALFRRSIQEGPLLMAEPLVFGQSCGTPRFVEPPAVKRKPFQVRKRWVVLILGWSMVSGAAAIVVLRRRRRRAAGC